MSSVQLKTLSVKLSYVENSKCENSLFVLSSKLKNKYYQILAISSDIK